jgi:hypothetical protein
LPMAYVRIGSQFALSMAFSFLHDLVPMDPYRLLIYTQRVLCMSRYTVGIMGVGAGIDAGVTGAIMGVPNGGLGRVGVGIVFCGYPSYGPVLPDFAILGCRIDCVRRVGCKAKRTF